MSGFSRGERDQAYEWVGLVQHLTLKWTEGEAREEAYQRNRSKHYGGLTWRVVVGDAFHEGRQQYWVCEDQVAARLMRMGFPVLSLD